MFLRFVCVCVLVFVFVCVLVFVLVCVFACVLNALDMATSHLHARPLHIEFIPSCLLSVICGV